MNFLQIMKSVFTRKKEILDDWNKLTETEEVDQIIEASSDKPQLIYKHSFTCGICHSAKDEIEARFDDLNSKAAMNFVDVKNNRPVSNNFAEQLNVRHESPQVLIIDQGECIWDESHWGIKSDAVLKALN